MIAEYERTKIMERTRRGRRFAARQGRVSVLAHAPYGYRYVRKREGEGEARYDIVPEEAAVVREIFTWVGVEGLSLGEVVQRLAERGVLTSTGQPRWCPTTIRDMLRNPAYAGTAKYGKTRNIPRPPGRRPKRGDPPIPRQDKVTCTTLPEEQESISVPGLVSGELFEAVSKQLDENRRRYREQKQGAEFLLSGLLVCHCCGAAYCGRRHACRAGSDQRYVYYRCLGTDKYRYGGESRCTNKSVNGMSLETAVWSDVCALLQDPERLRREVERRLERPPAMQVDALHLEASITKLKQRMARLLDAYENDWLQKKEFESRMSRVKECLTREEEALAQYERSGASEGDLRLIVEQFQMFTTHVSAELEHADFATQRKLLRMLVKRIEVDHDEVRIVYKVQPHPFVLSPARGVLQHCSRRHPAPLGLSNSVTELQG